MTSDKLEILDYEIQRLHTRRANLVLIGPKADELNLEWSLCNEHLDFDQLPHSAVIRVLKHFGGDWDKTPAPDSDKINYTRTEPLHGFLIRCWCGEPPPSCRIIEEEVEVPEQIVPAHTKTVRKLVCK